jgi:hypothetical protein
MKNILFILIFVIFIVMIFIIFIKINDEKFCFSDNDCSCGVKITTGECFVGNKKFVNPNIQCPDFCTGIHGKFVTKCVNNKCVLFMS